MRRMENTIFFDYLFSPAFDARDARVCGMVDWLGCALRTTNVINYQWHRVNVTNIYIRFLLLNMDFLFGRCVFSLYSFVQQKQKFVTNRRHLNFRALLMLLIGNETNSMPFTSLYSTSISWYSEFYASVFIWLKTNDQNIFLFSGYCWFAGRWYTNGRVNNDRLSFFFLLLLLLWKFYF